MSDATTGQRIGQIEQAGAAESPQILAWIKEQLSKRDVQVGLAALAALLLLFMDLTIRTARDWFNPDSYYQHGPLVPLAMLYIYHVRRDKIERHALKPGWWALPILIFLVMFQVFAVFSSFFVGAQAYVFVATLVVTTVVLYGLPRAWAMAPATLFVMAGLPMWSRLIDDSTNRLQIWSTDGAYVMLKAVGMNPIRLDPTVIHLDNFELLIAAACSGMKLTLAMIATVVFIILVARLKWWANLVLLALSLPLAVAINSLRITLIGIFGDKISSEAGFLFHDYGSYLTLALAFYILYVVAKKLGWKV